MQVENTQLIVGLKIKLILLAVAAQSLQEFEDYKRQQTAEELSSKDLKQWKRTEANLGYLVELIEPKVLKLQVFESHRLQNGHEGLPLDCGEVEGP